MNSGLYGADGNPVNIPLQAVRIHGEITGLFGEISIEQRYVNNKDKDLEIIYTFPMPDRAVVSSFNAQVGARSVKGEIMDREEAFKVYDQALNAGDSAFLLEQFRPNIFQVSLGRVFPGEEVKIEIVYLETAQYQEGEIRIFIPTLVAPRYIPGRRKGERQGMGWAEPTEEVPDADFITPPVDRNASYQVELQLAVRPIIPVDEFTSPSHQLSVRNQADGSMLITLAEGSTLLDRDIIIVGRCRDGSVSSGVFWQDPRKDEGYLYLNLLPDFPYEDEHKPLNYLFLIDISGSMDGVKLKQAKNALKLCLRNMENGDAFNIVAFESECHYFSPGGIVSFNQLSLDRAGHWIDQLGAMGGTEITEALQFALKSSEAGESVILLFTDGQVGNEEDLICLVRRGIKDNRLFTFGIDTAVNSFFINKLAEAGGGLAEFIYPGERVEDRVIRQFSRINSPTVRNITVKWDQLRQAEAYPEYIPALFNLEPLALTAKYMGKPAGRAVVFGKLNGQEIQMEMDLEKLEHLQGSGFLKKHWAKMKIGHLEKLLEEINPRRKHRLIDQLVGVSKEFGIGSSHTSFVAVQERLNKDTGIPETVVVPVTPAAEWDMLLPAPPVLSSGFPGDLSARFNIKPGSIPRFRSKARFSMQSMPVNMEMMIEENSFDTGAGADDPLQEALRILAMQQKADGAFPGDERAPNVEGSTYENTALAILGILLSAGDSLNTYRRQVEKSVRFLLIPPPEKSPGQQQLTLVAHAFRVFLSKMHPGKKLSTAVMEEIGKIAQRTGSQIDGPLKPGFDSRNVANEVLALLGCEQGDPPDLNFGGSVRELAISILRGVSN